MGNKIQKIYGIICVIAVGILIVIGVCCSNQVFQSRNGNGYVRQLDYEYWWEEDSSAPCGGRNVISFEIKEPVVDNCNLIFYSIHQSIEVYIGEEKVYSLKPDEGNPFGRTPGNVWNSIPLYRQDVGQPVRICLIPAYDTSIDLVPDIYLGSEYSLFVHLLQRNLMVAIMSFVAMVSGIAFILFHIYNRKYGGSDKSLFQLGIFSLWIGIWKFSELTIAALLTKNALWMSYLPLVSLLLVLIPFLQFVKTLFPVKDERLWTVLSVADTILVIVILFLQVTGIQDLRQNLYLNHMFMVLLVIAVPIRMGLELKQRGWSHKMKITAVCMAACLCGLAIDLFIYYIFRGVMTSGFGMCAFLAYILILGALKLRENRYLIAAGMQAKHFEKMAFQDPLTGIYSRAAYMDDVNDPDFVAEDRIVVMCDLNNLKYCNDTYGHEAGDRYLIESARLIREVFSDIGRCYRMGGDEFCILLQGISDTECEEHLASLKQKMEEYNRENPEAYPIYIACGASRFDREKDFKISDTMRRADKVMYKDKMEMKMEHSFKKNGG